MTLTFILKFVSIPVLCSIDLDASFYITYLL